MIALRQIACRVDAICARLNAGLCAVAVALTVLTVSTWVGRHPEMFQVEYDAVAAAAGASTAF
jgi:hypothetical protein